MKGTIFDIRHLSRDREGKTMTIVMFKGCPMRCIWCDRPEGMTATPQLAYHRYKCTDCGKCAEICACHGVLDGKHVFDRTGCTSCGKCADFCSDGALALCGRDVTVDELVPELLADKDQYEISGGGVTLSGGECLMQPEFCAELLRALKENGINTAVSTCGNVPYKSLDAVIPYTDTFIYDIKAVNDNVHIRLTGQSNRQILENLLYLNSSGARIELTIPFIPDHNISEMAAIADFIEPMCGITKVHVVPYCNGSAERYESLGMADTMHEKSATESECEKFQKVFDYITERNGLYR